MTIPASQDVRIIPGVIGTGGNPLSLNEVMLTSGQFPPVGTVPSFPSAAAVEAYFGPGTPEAAAAAVYFAGFLTSTAKPSALFFSQYPVAAVAGYLLGGSVAALTLTQLQALSGTITLSVDGTPETSTAISLTGATSFSNAATLIQAQMTGVTVAYSSQHSAFVVTSDTTGATSAVGPATVGSLATGLGLTTVTGALASPGAAAPTSSTPAAAMTAITKITQNWATFQTLFDPDASGVITNKLAFAQWSNGQQNRWLYIEWDGNIAATESGVTTSFGAVALADELNGCCANYSPGSSSPADPTNPMLLAAFVGGTVASINFNAKNGRIATKFKGSSLVSPGVTDQTVLNNLEANGYNCYGAYATANQPFQYYAPGQMPGEWDWIDTYVDQIFLNNQFQLAFMELMTTINSIPYNTLGDSYIRAAAQDPIAQFVNFGGIQPNVVLSAAQIAEVVAATGDSNAPFLLQSVGWYLQVLPSTPQTRGLRQSPPCSFFYTDGGSVQQITLNSVDVM